MNNKAKNPDFNEQDNEFFEVYLKGDSPLSRTYKNINCREPSDHLNQAILSAARASSQSQTHTKRHWTQARSLAASIAIFSLVGILAHNTWLQEEKQSALPEQKLERKATANQAVFSRHSQPQLSQPQFSQPLAPLSKRSESKTSAKLMPKEQKSGVLEEQQYPANKRKQQNTFQDNEKNTHELMSTSLPMATAPAADGPSAVGPSAMNMPDKPHHQQASFTDEALSIDHQIQEHEHSHEKRLTSSGNALKQVASKAITEQQIMLNKIIRLIKSNKISQARELLQQFKTKYPEYPIDPVILEQLPPY